MNLPEQVEAALREIVRSENPTTPITSIRLLHITKKHQAEELTHFGIVLGPDGTLCLLLDSFSTPISEKRGVRSYMVPGGENLNELSITTSVGIADQGPLLPPMTTPEPLEA